MTKTELNIHYSESLDRGLAYGEACFETFRVVDGEVFGWNRHMSRLSIGLRSFGISLSKSNSDSIRAHVLKKAGDVAADALVRVTVTGGVAEWGLPRSHDLLPEVHIQTMPYVLPHQDLILSTAEWPFSVQSKCAKFSSDYALTLRAMQLWQQDGLSVQETALICKEGRVLSTSTSNVLIYREDRWFTPDETGGGVLPGVIRDELISDALVESYNCPVDWLSDCEAIALTNSGFFIRPASMVNGRTVNSKHQAFDMLCQALRGKPGVAEL
ncbi:MAG: aminotransferase class IV [Mariprofundaceae bacterium]